MYTIFLVIGFIAALGIRLTTTVARTTVQSVRNMGTAVTTGMSEARQVENPGKVLRSKFNAQAQRFAAWTETPEPSEPQQLQMPV